MYTAQTKDNGRLVYLTIYTPLKPNDFAYCKETNEVIQIAEVLDEDHYYKDTKGNHHYDNYDPWCWLKIIKTNDPEVYNLSDRVEKISIEDYLNFMV